MKKKPDWITKKSPYVICKGTHKTEGDRFKMKGWESYTMQNKRKLK